MSIYRNKKSIIIYIYIYIYTARDPVRFPLKLFSIIILFFLFKTEGFCFAFFTFLCYIENFNDLKNNVQHEQNPREIFIPVKTWTGYWFILGDN